MLPVILAIWLSGCAGAASDCPPFVAYSAAEQRTLAAELGAMHDRYPLVRRTLIDYARLRGIIRACRKRR